MTFAEWVEPVWNGSSGLVMVGDEADAGAFGGSNFPRAD